MWTWLIFLDFPPCFVTLALSVGSLAPKISVNLLSSNLKLVLLKKQCAAVTTCLSLIREALQWTLSSNNIATLQACYKKNKTFRIKICFIVRLKPRNSNLFAFACQKQKFWPSMQLFLPILPQNSYKIFICKLHILWLVKIVIVLTSWQTVILYRDLHGYTQVSKKILKVNFVWFLLHIKKLISLF